MQMTCSSISQFVSILGSSNNREVFHFIALFEILNHTPDTSTSKLGKAIKVRRIGIFLFMIILITWVLN